MYTHRNDTLMIIHLLLIACEERLLLHTSTGPSPSRVANAAPPRYRPHLQNLPAASIKARLTTYLLPGYRAQRTSICFASPERTAGAHLPLREENVSSPMSSPPCGPKSRRRRRRRRGGATPAPRSRTRARGRRRRRPRSSRGPASRTRPRGTRTSSRPAASGTAPSSLGGPNPRSCHADRRPRCFCGIIAQLFGFSRGTNP